jgi:hypothetical protein
VRSSCLKFGGLSDLIAEISKKEGEALGIFAPIVGQSTDSNFHETIMANKKIQ